MKKTIVTLLAVTISLSHSPLRADSPGTETPFVEAPIADEVQSDTEPSTQPEQITTENTTPSEEIPSDVTPQEDVSVVGPTENTEGYKRARNKRWQNYLLAVCAVAVAVTALLIVANHEGHKSHH